jgi:16S rRNA (uracil1498-N3)-methyltransferase
MRRRFFVESFDDETAVVRGESAAHLARVLRAERGQLYELSDGNCVWLARVAWVKPEAVEFALEERVATLEESTNGILEITLLLSIIKFDRMEWCLEKATEMGASTIVPLAASRSEKTLVQAAAKRAERWGKILRQSAEQSRRLRPAILGACEKPAAAFAGTTAVLRLMCSEMGDAKPMREVLESAKQRAQVALAIGPEGGWTSAEIASAEAAGFQQVGLGGNILRTETAVIAALAMVQYASGGMSVWTKDARPQGE